MHFVQSGMLGALAALAIPIIIHLMLRRQARPVDLGTLQFLKVVIQANTRKQRIKRFALLALRLAGVALIALLFARPFLLADEPGGGDHLVVVLVDRSASMGLSGGPRPIDRARAEVRDIAAGATTGAKVEIVAFDRAVAPVARLGDLDQALADPLVAGTDHDAALAWARDRFVRSGAQRKTLHILTDLQKSGLSGGDAAPIPRDVVVHLSDLGRPFPRNVAVVGVMAAPANPRPGEPVLISATIRNLAPLPVAQIPVHLHLEAAGLIPIDLDRTIDLDGDATGTVEFPLGALDEGLRTGFVAVAASDDLSSDDRRYLACAVAGPPRILLVDGDPGRSARAAETYFLHAALRLAPAGETYAQAPYDPRVIDLFDLRDGLPDLAKTAVVVLANVADLAPALTRGLARFVAAGGGLLVFTGDRVTADGSASLVEAGLGVGTVVGPRSAPERPWRLERWDTTHPLLRPFAAPEHGDLRRPTFAAITAIQPDPGTRVVAWFRGGEPAILERPVGRGRVIWFASSCDRDWTDWPRGRLFLPLVHQLVTTAAGRGEGGPIRAEVAAAGQPFGVVEAEGIIHVRNPDPAESEPARRTPRDFATRYGFPLIQGRDDTATTGTARPTADDRFRSDEVWPWVALTLVGVLMLELFLANRTAA